MEFGHLERVGPPIRSLPSLWMILHAWVHHPQGGAPGGGRSSMMEMPALLIFTWPPPRGSSLRSLNVVSIWIPWWTRDPQNLFKGFHPVKNVHRWQQKRRNCRIKESKTWVLTNYTGNVHYFSEQGLKFIQGLPATNHYSWNSFPYELNPETKS